MNNDVKNNVNNGASVIANRREFISIAAAASIAGFAGFEGGSAKRAKAAATTV